MAYRIALGHGLAKQAMVEAAWTPGERVLVECNGGLKKYVRVEAWSKWGVVVREVFQTEVGTP